jgi:hypothetical protein
MKTNLDNTLLNLCNALKQEFGSRLNYYGEGVRSLSNNSAANYITVDYNEPCAVNDVFDKTIFIVRENADTTAQTGGGMNRTLSRTVDFRLVANTKTILDEYRVAVIMNQLEKVNYNSSSFEQDTIARNYFGLNERNTESAFFTVSFSVLETITCKPCK